jgi:hypothetical protein
LIITTTGVSAAVRATTLPSRPDDVDCVTVSFMSFAAASLAAVTALGSPLRTTSVSPRTYATPAPVPAAAAAIRQPVCVANSATHSTIRINVGTIRITSLRCDVNRRRGFQT